MNASYQAYPPLLLVFCVSAGVVIGPGLNGKIELPFWVVLKLCRY